MAFIWWLVVTMVVHALPYLWRLQVRPPCGVPSLLGLVNHMNEHYLKTAGGNMSKERDGELEQPENWDFTRPEVREPVKTSRVVVSVAFRRDDFTTVSQYAERIGKRTSEFIREASIEKASRRGVGVHVYWSGSLGTLWSTTQMPADTIAVGSPQERPEEVHASTY